MFAQKKLNYVLPPVCLSVHSAVSCWC